VALTLILKLKSLVICVNFWGLVRLYYAYEYIECPVSFVSFVIHNIILFVSLFAV